jgi:Galactose oxidase, central domain
MKTKNPRSAMVLSALLAILTVAASGQMLSRISPSRRGFRTAANQQESNAPAANQHWSLLFPTDIFDERGAAAAVYDQPTNSLIVFSGGNFNAVPNDVIALSNANGIGTPDWTTVIPDGAPGSPAARTFSTGVYDQANSRMIVFGGCSFSGGFCTNFLNDVWVLTNANGVAGAPTWEQLTPAGAPPAPRWAQGAAYDPVNNRMIIYGGDNQSVVFSDTWVLSNANGLGGTPTWTQLSPAGGPPEGQDTSSVVYDSTNNVLIEFAGTMNDFGQDTNSVWTLSNANGLGGTPVWKNIVKNGKAGPPKRDGLVSAYDSANNRMLIFGGNANTPNGFPQLNDAWVLANANGLSGKPKWIKLAPSGLKPSGRTLAIGGYDATNNRLIIYGGVSWEADFFSTWVLTGANGLQ